VQAGAVELLEDLLGGFAVEQGVHFLGVGEHERQVPDLHFLDPRRQRRERADVELLRAGLDALQLLLVAAQHRAVERLQLHVVVGVLRRQFDKLVHRRRLRVAVRHRVPHLARHRRQRAARRQHAQRTHHQQLLQCKCFHL
jgi:hypothetical protein